MERRNYKLRHLASACGVAISTVSGWKSGESVPGPETMRKLASFLGVSMEYLYSGTPEDSRTSYDFTEKTLEAKEESGPMIRPNEEYILSPEDPTPQRCLDYFKRYLDEARKVPGGVGYAWVQLQQHFSFDVLERMKGNPKKED